MSRDRWWTEDTVALVTGANKGIGLEVARQLCQNGVGHVILTARNEERGRAALHSLTAEGHLNCDFHLLDATSDDSASHLAEWLNRKYGKLDILINNAAVNGSKVNTEYLITHKISLQEAMENQSITEAFIVEHDTAKECMETNYFGVKRTIQALLPLLPSQSRIVNVSSIYGSLQTLKDEALREKLLRIESLTEEFIDGFVDRYLGDVKSGNYSHVNSIWPKRAASYRVSKMALNAYSRLLAKKLISRDDKIYVNCVHPGIIKTDMLFKLFGVSAAEGAANIVRVALLPPSQLPSGQIFMEGEVGDFL